MAIHVAILKPWLIGPILEGRKTIESRLTKTPRPPLGRIARGDRMFIKESGGPFRATALAIGVDQYENLTPAGVNALRQRYEPAVGGDDAYWTQRLGHRFAIFIHLGRVEPLDVGPRYDVAYMRAWYVLDEAASPLMDVPLSAGALRNRYVRLPRVTPGLQHESLTLHLPDGRVVRTELARHRMLRWRGWGSYFEAHHMMPGDVVRMVACGPAAYRVRFIPTHGP